MKARDRALKHNFIKIAQRLPFNYTVANCSEIVFGSDILEVNPDAKDKNGEPLDPSKKYAINSQQTMAVNHYKRLKRIYKRLGWNGIEEYCKGVIMLEKEAMTPTQIGGINTQYE